MSLTTYEVHGLEGKKLPLIFHYDIIEKGKIEIANWHENIELLYFTKGMGQVLCNSVVYEVSAGDLFIVNSGLLHYVKKDKPCEYYCLIVDSAFLAENDIPAGDIQFNNFVRSDVVSALFDRVVKELERENSFQIAGIRSAILSLMVHLSRYHSSGISFPKREHSNSDESIKKALAYISDHLSHKLSLEEIASHVNLSKYHFAREFKKATGMTVVAFLNATRCRTANRLLLSRQYSVNEVAAMCGFENNSYFSKMFKRVMGCLPSEVGKASHGI